MLWNIVGILVAIVCILFIARRWREAKEKRFVDESLELGAGSFKDKKRKSTIWYLFK
ncbi:hypothetical protein [Limnohabitans sp. Rim47]|uniref:hypothetical protein n=1 Tax=Limnohabitans sp. Rim47 TaxID=1100721 RepID=UPI0012DE0120|nr:hypothetical protein [Limnohabitans sp. Rim47]